MKNVWTILISELLNNLRVIYNVFFYSFIQFTLTEFLHNYSSKFKENTMKIIESKYDLGISKKMKWPKITSLALNNCYLIAIKLDLVWGNISVHSKQLR